MYPHRHVWYFEYLPQPTLFMPSPDDAIALSPRPVVEKCMHCGVKRSELA